MAKTQEFYVDIDMKKNAVKNVKFETVTALPATPFNGQVVEFEGVLQTYNGTKWVKYADDAQVQANKTDISGLKTTVGDTNSGLVKNVIDLQAALGQGGTGENSISTKIANLETALGSKTDEADAEGSAFARIAKNKADIAKNATDVADANSAAVKAQADATAAKTAAASNADLITTLQGTVGTQGDDIAALKTAVGTAASTGVEATGLQKKVADNTAKIDKVKATADAAAVKTDVDTALGKKVDKVTGKGLSTEDYTTDEKNKLTGIATGAQVNVIEAVKVGGTALTVTDKAVNIDLSGYALKTDISSAYKAMGSITFAELNALTLNETNKGEVYNVTDAFKAGDTAYPAGTNVLWTGTEWDPLAGLTDLSAYAKTTDVTTTINNAVKDKQDALTETQLKAVNSGINADKVGTYDGYSALITAAQETATAAQTAAGGKVAKNAAITAGTACKITYDAKGLVTKGEALEVADLPSIPVSKITGTLPLDQCPVVAVSKKVTASAGTALTIASGLTTALMAQVLDGNGNVVQCGIQISGASVALEFSEAFTGTVSIVGLR